MAIDAPAAPNRWSNSIDKYDLVSTLPIQAQEKAKKKQAEAQTCLDRVLANPEAKDALYQGIPKGADGEPIPPATDARKKFLDFLQDRILTKERIEPANVEGTKLEELLGSEGFQYYLAAIQEESQSSAFREAVMLRSTNHYDGPKWAQRVIAPFGGPSAAGKSVSQPALVEQISPYIPTIEGNNSGNDVVSVDGGVEREVSLIRGLVLQTALGLGYALIDDLDKHKVKDKKGKEVKLKNFVEEAALATPGLSIVIPQTYTSEATNILTGIGADDFKEYDQVDNGEAIVIFGIVEAEHENVIKNGTSRAANSSTFEKDDIAPDSKPPCESKAYHDHHFAGTQLSHAAQRTYENLDAHPNKPRITVTVTSDFTFIKQDPNALGGWVKAGKDEPWDKDMIGIVERDFDAYIAYKQKLSENFDSNNTLLKALIDEREIKKIQLNQVPENSAQARVLKAQIEDLRKNIKNTEEKRKVLFNETKGKDKDNIKDWLKANGWKQKPLTEIKVKPPKLNKDCVYVERNASEPVVGWKEVKPNKPWNASMISISKKDFEEFKTYQRTWDAYESTRNVLAKPDLPLTQKVSLIQFSNQIYETQLNSKPKMNLKDWLKDRQPTAPTISPETEKTQRKKLIKERQARKEKQIQEKRELQALEKEQKKLEKQEKAEKRLSKRRSTSKNGFKRIDIPAMKEIRPDNPPRRQSISFNDDLPLPQVNSRRPTAEVTGTKTRTQATWTPALQTSLAKEAKAKVILRERTASQGENLRENASQLPPRPPRPGRAGGESIK